MIQQREWKQRTTGENRRERERENSRARALCFPMPREPIIKLDSARKLERRGETKSPSHKTQERWTGV